CFAGDRRLSSITTAIPTVAVAVMTQRFLHRSDHGIRVTAATSLRSICSWVSWSDMSTKSLYAARVKFPLRRGRRFAPVAVGRCDFSGAADPRDPARSACSRQPSERIEPDPAFVFSGFVYGDGADEAARITDADPVPTIAVTTSSGLDVHA